VGASERASVGAWARFCRLWDTVGAWVHGSRVGAKKIIIFEKKFFRCFWFVRRYKHVWRCFKVFRMIFDERASSWAKKNHYFWINFFFVVFGLLDVINMFEDVWNDFWASERVSICLNIISIYGMSS